MKSMMRERMRAPYDVVFDLAARIERWPEILPHYRFVTAVPDPNGERRFAMGARRGIIPVRWEAIQRPMRDERRIEFVHTGGVTKGMWVEWRFTETDDGLDVSIEHHLELSWPLVGGAVARHVIGPQFIDAIAGRTLRRVRELAEASR